MKMALCMKFMKLHLGTLVELLRNGEITTLQTNAQPLDHARLPVSVSVRLIQPAYHEHCLRTLVLILSLE